MGPPTQIFLAAVGPSGSGKATVLGSLIYQCNGIDLLTRQKLEERGVRKYDELTTALQNLHVPLVFETRKHRIDVVDIPRGKPDCVLFVVSRDSDYSPKAMESLNEHLKAAKNIIIVVNKMDIVGWSNDQYEDIIRKAREYFSEFGINPERLSHVAISAIGGENVVEKRAGVTGTLIEAIDG